VVGEAVEQETGPEEIVEFPGSVVGGFEENRPQRRLRDESESFEKERRFLSCHTDFVQLKQILLVYSTN